MADKAVAKVCPFCKSTTWVSVPVEAYEACQMVQQLTKKR